MASTEIAAKRSSWMSVVERVNIRKGGKKGLIPSALFVIDKEKGQINIRQQNAGAQVMVTINWQPSGLQVGDITQFRVNLSDMYKILQQLDDTIVKLAFEPPNGAVLSTSRKRARFNLLTESDETLTPTRDPAKWIKYCQEFTVDVGEVADITKFESPSGEDDEKCILVSANGQVVSVTVGDRITDGADFSGQLSCVPKVLEGQAEQASSKFGRFVEQILDSLQGKITVSLGNNYPIRIHNESASDRIISDHYVAPQLPPAKA